MSKKDTRVVLNRLANKSRHVLTNQRGGWSVRTTGSERAERVFDTKGAAIRFAKVHAKEEGSRVVVHKKDGRIESVDSYQPRQGSERVPVKR